MIYVRTYQGHLATRARYQFPVLMQLNLLQKEIKCLQVQKISQLSINCARFVVSCVDPFKQMNMEENILINPQNISQKRPKTIPYLSRF